MEFLIEHIAARVNGFGRAAAVGVGAGLAAAVLVLVGSGFLTAAGFWLLSHEIGPIAAAAVMGTLMFGLAGVMLLVHSRQRRLAHALNERRAAEPMARDVNPLHTLVFDLCYFAGQRLFGRQK